MKIYFLLGVICCCWACSNSEKVLEYWENGEPKKVLAYVNDRRQEYYRFYYASGILEKEGVLNDTIPVYKWLNYYPSGELHQQLYYDEKGTLVDSFITYYVNGQIQEIGLWEHDAVKNGEWTSYYVDGTLKSQEHFVQGHKEGKQTYIDSVTGNKLIERYIEDGRLISRATKIGDTTHLREFYKNGGLKNSKQWLGKKAYGQWSSHYETGFVEWIGKYHYGKKVGKWWFGYDNGDIRAEGVFADTLLSKVNVPIDFEYRDPIFLEESKVVHLRMGEWTFWDGGLLETRIYSIDENGVYCVEIKSNRPKRKRKNKRRKK
ncbi:MAG: hypothetical protein GY810_08070 [Aureispira sp.]|nr:hypothetical protein [Aureispira sp.]